MKFKLDCYDVEMKAHFNIGKPKDNTMGVLNEISIVYQLAAERARMRGANSMANSFEKKSKEIYDALNDIGYYNVVKEAIANKKED